MTAASTQIIPAGSRNNVGTDFLGPYTAAQQIAIVTDKTAATVYASFDGANQQFKVNKIVEYTASNGIRLGHDVKWTGSNFTIISTQSDGADTGYTAVCGGGANANGRGAKFLAYGADHASLPGIAFVVGDGGPVRLQTISSSHDIDFQPGQNTMWSVTGSTGNLTCNSSNGGHISFARDGKALFFTVDAAVAAAGSDQAGATALSKVITQVTSGSGGIRLPAAVAGFTFLLITNVSGGAVNVYPATGDQLEDQAANVAVSLPNRTGMILWCISNDVWGYVVSA